MPEIIDNAHFEPSTATLKTWQGTRKNNFTCGNQEFSGFYQTSGISKDWGWVSLALIVEVIAILLTVYGGYSKGGAFLFGGIIVAVLFIILDYIGVLFHHSKVEEKCRWKNEFLTSDVNYKPIISKKFNKKYSKEVFGLIFIILSSILKVLAVYILMGTIISEIMILILAVFYFLVIYIHLNHTGFVVWEMKTSLKMSKDYERYVKTYEKFKIGEIEEGNVINAVKVRETKFNSSFKFNNVETNRDLLIGVHKIILLEEKMDIFYYLIQTKGVLEDIHIKSFCMGLNETEARFIGLECLKHQLYSYQI
jgi:hypothetical protein